MKPNDLIIDEDEKNYGDKKTGDIRKLQSLEEEHCVIAYHKNLLGRVILVKGKRKYYSWVIFRYGLDCGRRPTNIRRLGRCGKDDVKEFFKLVGDNFIVVDKEEFKQMKIKYAVDSL